METKNQQLNKKCSQCGKIKIRNDFYKAKINKDGFRSNCKECCNNGYSQWKNKNLDKLRKINNKSYHKIKNSFSYQYSRHKAQAKQRSIEFNLSKDDFKDLWKGECYYCGSKIETIGIDRVDSNKGYVKFNIISCCYRCNVAKNTMSIEEFINLCHKISQKHQKK